MAFALAYYISSFIISLLSPFWGFVLFMCSLLLRFQDHYPNITVIKPFTLLLFGMVLGCIIHKDKLSKISWRQDKLILYLFLLSIFGLLVMAPGEIISETYLFICSIAIYYFASRILQTPMQIATLFFCMGLSVVHLALLAIEDVAKFPDTTLYIDHATGRWQGLGYYENSNEFGQLMITTIPFLLACILIRKSIFLSIASIALMCVMGFVMIKSESRTVMVTLGLMFVGTFMLRGNGNIVKKAIIGGVMCIIMLTALTFMPGPIQDRMETVLDAGNDESFQGRTRSWDHGFAMLSWYPLTGVGKGQWIEYHGLMPHNSYVQVMAETGIFGIILFLMIIWQSLKQFRSLIYPAQPPNNLEDTVNVEDPEIEYPEAFQYSEAHEPMDNLDAEYTEEDPSKQDSVTLTNTEKTIAIAAFVTFAGWLLYIFLGNQGYSIWMYFYLGLCAAISNFIPLPEQTNEKDSDNLMVDI